MQEQHNREYFQKHVQKKSIGLLKRSNWLKALVLCQVFCGLTLTTIAQKAVGNTVDGKKEGAWTYYYDNGKVSAIEHFRNGVLDGTVEYFYSDGTKQGMEMWRNGSMEDSAKYFHKNGRVEKE